MHGADRIGGLSSANGVVFGRRAGAAAGRHALALTGNQTPNFDPQGHLAKLDLAVSPTAAQTASKDLAAVMQRAAMIDRSDPGLAAALERVAEMQREIAERSRTVDATDPSTGFAPIARRERLVNQLVLASSMLAAMKARPESRGAHSRTDAPAQDPALAAPSLTWLERT